MSQQLQRPSNQQQQEDDDDNNKQHQQDLNNNNGLGATNINELYAQLDAESYQQKVTELWDVYTEGLTIHRNDLLDLLEDLGFRVSMEELKEVVINELGIGGKDGNTTNKKDTSGEKGAGDQSTQRIPSMFDFDDALAVCMHFYQAANSRMRNGDGAGEGTHIDCEIEAHQYAWLVITGARQKHFNYIIIRPRFLHFTITPKKSLVLGAAAVLILMCILVVTVLAVLWIRNADADEKSYALRSLRRFDDFMREYENRDDALLKEVNDTASFLSTILDASYELVLQQELKHYGSLIRMKAIAAGSLIKPRTQQGTLMATAVAAALSVAHTMLAKGIGGVATPLDAINAIMPMLVTERKAVGGVTTTDVTDWDFVIVNTTTKTVIHPSLHRCNNNNGCKYMSYNCANTTTDAINPTTGKNEPLLILDGIMPIGTPTPTSGATVSAHSSILGATICFFKSFVLTQEESYYKMGEQYESLFGGTSKLVSGTATKNNLYGFGSNPSMPGGGSLTHLIPMETVLGYNVVGGSTSPAINGVTGHPTSPLCATASHGCENGAIKALVKTIAEGCTAATAAAKQQRSSSSNDSAHSEACITPLMLTEEAYDNSSQPVMCAGMSYGFPIVTNVVLMLCRSRMAIEDENMLSVISDVNTINTRQTMKGVELVVATRNRTNGVVNPQATKEMLRSGCMGTCIRSHLATVGQQAVLSGGKQYHLAITPDYRPQPVASAFVRLRSVPNVALGEEKDIVTYREMVSESVLNLVDSLNTDLAHVNIAPITNQVTYVPMELFSPRKPCGVGITCIDRLGYGTVYRSDCADCVREGRLGTPHLLRPLKGCDTSVCAAKFGSMTVYTQPFNGPTMKIDRGDSYNGHDSLHGATTIAKLGIGIVMHFYTEDRDNDVYRLIYIAIGVSVALVVTALLVFLLTSRNNLNQVEKEWTKYRKSISKQKTEFAKVVGDVVPPVYAALLFNPTSAIGERLNITIIFLNVVGFQRIIQDQDAEFCHDYLSYSFYAMNAVTRFYKMFKVKTFGDNFMIVGGVNRQLASRSAAISKKASADAITESVAMHDNIDDHEDLSIARCVEAAAVLMQVFSYVYTHNPQHIGFLRKRIRAKQLTDMGMLRIGICTGPTNLIMTRHDGFPFFLALSEAAACAYKLQQVAKNNNINISSDIKQALVRTGKDNLYVFGTDRMVTHKKIVFSSCAIQQANIPIPRPIIDALKLTRAACRMYYNEEGKLAPVGIPLGGLAPTLAHNSDRSSHFSVNTNSIKVTPPTRKM